MYFFHSLSFICNTNFTMHQIIWIIIPKSNNNSKTIFRSNAHLLFLPIIFVFCPCKNVLMSSKFYPLFHLFARIWRYKRSDPMSNNSWSLFEHLFLCQGMVGDRLWPIDTRPCSEGDLQTALCLEIKCDMKKKGTTIDRLIRYYDFGLSRDVHGVYRIALKTW